MKEELTECSKEYLIKQLEYSYKEMQRLKEEYMILQNASDKVEEELQQRIDKAIEYINENWGHWCSDHCKYATETINILQGVDKE